MRKYFFPVFTLLIILSQTAPFCLAASLTPAEPKPLVQQLWDAQKLEHFSKGELSLPDTFISQVLVDQLTASSEIQDIKITALDDNLIKLELVTRQQKKLYLEGRLEQFQHDKQSSHFKFKILKKSISDAPLTAWFFSHLSAGILTQLFGGIDSPAGLAVNIKRNTVDIDFHDFLTTHSQQLGQIGGIPASEIVKIHGITSSAGFIHIRTSLDLGSGIKHYLQTPLN